MNPEAATSVDDPPTLAALGVPALALADMSHEALRYGRAALDVGADRLFICTCYRTDSVAGKWISAGGGLLNLAADQGSPRPYAYFRASARVRYFLVLVAAFNLFFAFG